MKTLLKQELFWDVNLKNLNAIKHKDFIIKRILQRGDLDDLAWANNNYNKNYLKNVFLRNFKIFDDKSKNFWCYYFKIKQKNASRSN